MVNQPPGICNRARKVVIGGAAAFATVWLAGCTTSVESTTYRSPQARSIEYAQVATDADFSRYSKLQPEPLGIFFPKNVTLPDEDNRRIRQIFRAAFLAELEGYELVGEPGPGVMNIQGSLIDMRSGAGVMPPLRRGIDELATPGKIVFLMEMHDSETGRTLARGADSAAAPVLATEDGMETDWDSVEVAVARWARLFRQFLDQNLAQ
ncbi:MAG: DUF3313 family protein [Pseudomonadota bacterium]